MQTGLSGLGFPEPVRGDSGNGAHLLYRIDLPNDESSKNLIRQCLVTLDVLFSDPLVAVDTANYNAGRIWKLYGTMSRKGDHTAGRPHRRSRILSVLDPVIVVNDEQLQDLASRLPTGAQVPPEVPVEGKGYKNILNLPDWLDKHGILVKSEKSYQDGRIYLLDSCPFSSAHKDGAYVIRFANGAVFAGCHHASRGGGSSGGRICRNTMRHERNGSNGRGSGSMLGKKRERIQRYQAKGAEYQSRVFINLPEVYLL